MFKRKAKVITVSGGKGGTGKTFVSVNLAALLASTLPVREIKNDVLSGNRVLLIDADYHLGNTHLLLGIKQHNYLDKVIDRELDIKEFISHTDFGVDLLSFGGDDKKISDADGKFNDAVLGELKKLEELYDWIIVDTGAGLNRTILNQIVFADHALLVLNPESTSLLDTYKLIKFIQLEKNRPKSLNIVINKTESLEEAQKTYSTLENTKIKFGVKIKTFMTGLVYLDKDLFTQSLSRGIPAVVLFPGSHYEQSFQQIADYVAKSNIVKNIDSFFEKLLIGSY